MEIGAGTMTRPVDIPMRTLAARVSRFSRGLSTTPFPARPRWFWVCDQSPQCKGFVGWADHLGNKADWDPPPPGHVYGSQTLPFTGSPPVGQHPQAASPQQRPPAQLFHTPAAMAGAAAARRLPASMGGGGQLGGSPMTPPSAGRGSMQYGSAPLTPQSSRSSQPSTRTPQVGPAKLRFKQLDSQQFAISFDFDWALVESVKNTFHFRDREWHPESKTWRFPLSKYEDVQRWALQHFSAEEISLLEENGPGREIPPPCLEPPSFADGKIRQYITPETWNRLYQFQKDGIIFAVRHGGRALIADDMGLGKTVQAICVAACFHDDWPLLVVCPSSMILTWLEGLNDWLPPHLLPDRDNLVVITAGKDVDKKLNLGGTPPTRHIVIASYDCAQKLRGYERHFGMLICDESHMLKSPVSKRTQFFTDLVISRGTVRRLVFLTGTPVLSRPNELFTQIDMLRPGLLGTYDEFGERYCGAKVSVAPGKLDWRGAQNLEELNGILREHLLIRRLKQDVLHELPPMRRSRLTILPDPDLLPHVEAVKREMAELDAMAARMSEEAYDSAKQMLLMKLYRVTGPVKVKPAVEHISNLLAQGRKLLVFAHHKVVLNALEDALKHMRVGDEGPPRQVGHMRIDGRSSAQARGDAVAVFQRDPNCRVALLAIRAAGAGITLHAANTVLFVELAWTPADLTQAEARAHRLGQDQQVNVQYLLAPGSADDIIWSLVQSKLRVVGNALDGHLAGTATGLRITDARQFVGWAAGGGPLPAAPSDDEDDEGLPEPSSQPVMSTPEARRDSRPEPSTSGTRRRRSTSPGAEDGGRAGSGTRGRRRLDFDQGTQHAQVEVIDLAQSQASNNVAGSYAGTAAATQQMSMGTFFSDSDEVWDAEVAAIDKGNTAPGVARQSTRSQPCQPGARASRQGTAGPRGGPSGGGGLGIFADDDDEEFDAALASPEMDAMLSQGRSSQPAPDAGGASGAGGRGRGSRSEPEPEHLTQQYFPAQPPYSPYGQPQQRATGAGPHADVATASAGGGSGQRGPAASAWDYPAQPPPPAQVVDLTGEESQ
ncbi:probable SWI/SNF-related matrix-associated actin-dependent regulator [Coccomyxa sp. Obi]|nr:probable SWI/SNF-related matrix-associated actin-dependent regulator [Coccomyxa sp. Obi]